MAFTDHTAHARLWVRSEPKSKPIPAISSALDAAGDERERRRVCELHRAGAALAIAVMDGLLQNHRASRQSHAENKRMSLLSLNGAQCFGLETAIDLLHHYVDTLTPGRGG